MPELPEIKAHAKRIEQATKKLTLDSIDIFTFSTLKTFDPQPKDLSGRKLCSVTSRGKLLVLEFESNFHCVIHLMQAGRLKVADGTKKPRGSIAKFTFQTDTDPLALLFTEAGKERRAGLWLHSENPLTLPPLEKLGPDADSVDFETFKGLLEKETGRIHGVLRKQAVIAGIGRMLANEILHRAQLSPFASVSKLTEPQFQALYDSMNQAISFALEHEQTLDEIGSAKDRPSLVHNRAGMGCETCETDKIRTIEYNSYTVCYCPTCQTNGKKLADNTTSKFLK